MNEIKCPKCNEVFKVDESGFAEILKQVRDEAFDKAIKEREALLKEEKESAIKLAEAKTQNLLQAEIAELKSKVEAANAERELAITKALQDIEKERDTLKSELSKKDDYLKISEAKIKSEMQDIITQRNIEIAELKTKTNASDTEKQLAVSEAVRKIEIEREALASELKTKETEKQLLESNLREQHLTELKIKDDLIAYYKDMKAKLSTKMVGETLEQHCEIQFNQIRATAFPAAYFEKDNDSKSGSKGDYIFRDNDQDGNEILSIMFEMKNEGDETATKKKNEDFYKELDKDRNEKGCEYAILVSLLESDSELFNSGIVDVSYKYPKM